MKNVRLYIEKYFERWGRLVCRHRLKMLLIMLAISLALMAQMPKLRIDVNSESYFKKGEQTLINYNAFRDQFGLDEMLIVGIEPPDVFDLGFLEKLRQLHRELEANTPYLADITSLINARNTRGEGDTLVVDELLKQWPKTKSDLAVLRQRVLSNPLYADLLISRDGTFTTLVLKGRARIDRNDENVLSGFGEETPPPAEQKHYLETAQKGEMVQAVEKVVEKYRAPDFRIYLGGGPAVDSDLQSCLEEDLAWLTPLSMLVTALFLLLLFRRVSGVIYPMLTVVLSLCATMGAMAALGIPMTDVGHILPTFLTVVGVGDSVHILSIFYQEYSRSGDKVDAISRALGHSALAVLMTSLTTAGGLASFLVADAAPIADLGIIAPMGVLFALLYTLVLLPALIALLPVGRGPVREARSGFIDRMLAAIALISCEHWGKILLVSGLVFILSLAGMSQVRFAHNILTWLPKDSAARNATALMDKKLRGTVTLEVVIDTGRPGGLYNPEFMKKLETSTVQALDFASGDIWIGKAWSVDTILKEINRALNENRPKFYVVPDDRKLIAQEFLLFEGSGSDDLEEVIDRDFRKVRLTMKAPFGDLFHCHRILGEVKSYFATAYPDANVEITGIFALFSRMVETAISSMIKSYLISLVVITLLMMSLIGRVRIGMLSMIPNLLPLFALVGLMGWIGIPFDLSNTIIGSVAIGLVVDDTIHFMHNFRRYFEQSGDVSLAVTQTLHTVGRAMAITSVVLACGFFVCLFSDMLSTRTFGLLMGLAVIFALAADFFLTPALMVLSHRKKNEVHNQTATISNL